MHISTSNGPPTEAAPATDLVPPAAAPEPLTVALLTIGDELNRGEIVDSNAAWLGRELSDLGLHVRHRLGVNDHQPDIIAALQQASQQARVVIVTGGLGPTSDDVTVDAAAALLQVHPIEEPAHAARLRAACAERGRPVTAAQLRMVRVPRGALVLENLRGRAPGFRALLHGAEVYFLPGVPREMMPMFHSEVIPRLQPLLRGGGFATAARRTYRVIGLGESQVDQRLQGLLSDERGPYPVSIHYRLAFPEVLITLVARGEDEEAARATLARVDPALRQRLGGALYGEGPAGLPEVIGALLGARGATAATAESCTGGLIGELLTSVAGSSSYFLGGVISYANEVKTGVLGVREATLQEHGAVSKACVAEMALGARRLLRATYGVAVSGVAGPGGGSADKPVGTIWLAVAGPGAHDAELGEGVVARRILWPGEREQVRRVAAYAALNLLREILSPPEHPLLGEERSF